MEKIHNMKCIANSTQKALVIKNEHRKVAKGDHSTLIVH